MGSTARAELAYGYDLGSSEDFKAAERDEYGGPKLPWLPVDEDGDPDYEDLGEEFEKAIAGLDGVAIEYSGHADNPGLVLIARGSEQSVQWADVMVLDFAKLEHPPIEWFDRLTAAIEALGITPTQDWPRWLVFPSYG
jgi:hypothetical protein